MGCVVECPVADVKLKYVNAQRDRLGCIKYWYFRRAGVRQRLPGQPCSEEFAAAY